MKSLVSILVPAYNAEQWIGDTLRSAVGQSWPHKEIIVVDDGSKDQTLAVARQFESSSVRVVRQENQGAAAARNTAFSLSQGDYIQWLDADDLLAPDKIARQMDRSDDDRASRALLSSAFGQFMYRYRRTEFIPTALWCDLSPVEWLTRKMGQNLYMQTSTWLASRALTEAAGPWNTNLLGDDDGEYFCRVLMQSNEVRFVPEAKVYYRMSGSGSLSYIGRSDRKMDAQWHSMRLHVEYLRSLEDNERTRAACVQFLQNWLASFYPQRQDIIKQAEELARELGGKLRMPRLSWKYAWMESLFGWPLAHRMQVLLQAARWSLARHWDRTLFRVESRGLAGRSEC